MIHIATVHYESDKWVDIQLDYIKRYLKQEYRIYAFLSGEAIKHRDKYFFSCCEPIKGHAIKLNILANIIYLVANSNDVIMFIDGDAFPIAPLDNFIKSTMDKYPLAAIQRFENFGDCQPHPSFCIVKVHVWKQIQGDWKSGYKWTLNDNSKRTDVGGNLLKLLIDNKIEWKPILRSKSLTSHPIMFGIYGAVIYHHCNGFRDPIDRIDRHQIIKKNNTATKIIKWSICNLIPNKFKRQIQKLLKIDKKIIDKNKLESDRIYNSFKSN